MLLQNKVSNFLNNLKLDYQPYLSFFWLFCWSIILIYSISCFIESEPELAASFIWGDGLAVTRSIFSFSFSFTALRTLLSLLSSRCSPCCHLPPLNPLPPPPLPLSFGLNSGWRNQQSSCWCPSRL
jgi:hypothetical protein